MQVKAGLRYNLKRGRKQIIIKAYKEGRVQGCCHKNEHKQGRAGLLAISVTPRPQRYTAVICRCGAGFYAAKIFMTWNRGI